ncbi:MAG: S8 family serine peptidase [Candidatus Eisenbacteria bacterium]|nr:S8 family serine peptidase [Candidatus Eisenbacteria bacterium]
MIRALVIPPTVAMMLLASGAARSSGARTPGLPVLDPSRDVITGPAYLADRLELRIGARAARAMSGRAIRVSASARPRLSSLGVPEVDRVAQSLGAWFEPEFAGESPPGPGSGEPDFTTFYIAHLPPGARLESALERFRLASGVESADPIGILPVAATPDDSLWSASYWYEQLSGHDIHASTAWDVTTGDTSIVVAVLDTGLLPYHPDLGGSTAGLTGQIWINRAERGGTPYLDDDGNGFVDDVWGWDFVAEPSLSGVTPGEDALDQDNDPNDFAGHGTFVAGLIGALTNNSIGVSGTAWNVRLMAVRVGWSASGNPLGLVDMSYVAQGIRYATRMGASVINCSFATLDQSGLSAAAEAAERAGVTIVAASGNGGQPHDLASLDDVIAVAATDAGDIVAGFSNLGDFVDLSAPGVAISSTFVTHASSDSIGMRQPSYLSTLNGTSFAAPLASGAVALMQAHQIAIGRPPLWPTAALLRLRETTDDIAPENPSLTGYGTGRLNLLRALTDPPGSTARRTAAENVGPAVVLPSKSGRATLAYVTTNSKLMMVDGLTGDTLALVKLPGQPAFQMAGADLKGGKGVGLFVGTRNGKMAGFDRNGTALPGWPVSVGGFLTELRAGPALGDIDSDGVLEVVCGCTDGNLYAWHADGSDVSGFPLLLDPSGITAAVAIAPLDSISGVEIVVTTGSGVIHVIAGDGSERTGWPVSLGVPLGAPTVGDMGAGNRLIMVPVGHALNAYRPNGTLAWSATFAGTAAGEGAFADLDRDGADELIGISNAPSEVGVFGALGDPWSARGFPVAVSAFIAGGPVVGPLGAGGRPAILVNAGGLEAITDSAVFLAQFPKPGGAGRAPALADLAGDGHTRVAAGSGSDSAFYVYDAGAGTFAPLASSWPTPRANDARTGTRTYAPAIPALDDVAPAAVTDLSAGWAAPDSVVLTWIAPGDDGPVGRAWRYELRVSSARAGAADFAAGFRADLPAPDSAGTPERFAFRVTAHGTPLFFALRTRDLAGNVAVASNVAGLITPLGGPLVVTTLTAAAAADSAVMLRWSEVAGASGYEVRGSSVPIDSATFEAAPLRLRVTAHSGGADSLRIGSLEPGTTWWFALRAIDAAGNAGPRSNVASATVPVGGALGGRGGIALAVRGQPSGRPVRFDWQGAALGDRPRIEIFDVGGRRVRALALEPGRFGGSTEWNGRDEDSRSVPAGLYFARLTCGSVHAQTRVVLLP